MVHAKAGLCEEKLSERKETETQDEKKLLREYHKIISFYNHDDKIGTDLVSFGTLINSGLISVVALLFSSPLQLKSKYLLTSLFAVVGIFANLGLFLRQCRINLYMDAWRLKGRHVENQLRTRGYGFDIFETQRMIQDDACMQLDALIAGSGKKTSTFLQLLKETAMRAGEAKRLEWTSLDFEKRLVTLNQPEKGSNPRIWKVSSKLIAMMNALPKKSLRVFGEGPVGSLRTTYIKTRKRLAAKLQNPRLSRISFHTFRHWAATSLYHRTKDPLLVKEFLGHKKLDSTLLYIQLEQAIYKGTDDEFTVKVARTPDEVKPLLEVGFEYICEKDGLLFLRKRK